jgi:peptidoglycan/xylan/chitin deacetylase (PgdA/CDA1 family)
MTANGVIVLMYHRVGSPRNAWESRYAIAPERFKAHMSTLADEGMQAVPLKALVRWIESGEPLPSAAFALTFDDGFRSVREHALPVLAGLRWPFTVFLVADLLGRQDV